MLLVFNFLLVNPHIIHDELHRGVIRVYGAGPVCAHRQINKQVKGLVEGVSVRLG